MKSPIAFCIFKQPIIILIQHSYLLIFVLLAMLKIIPVNKILPSIIRRININHLDLAEIALLQDFQDFQIIALDIEVLRGIPVAAVCFYRAQRFGDRPRRFGHSRLFTNPCKFIALVAVHYIPAQKLLQNLKIDPAFDFPILAPHLRDCRGEQSRNFVYVFRYHVRCFKFHVIHVIRSILKSVLLNVVLKKSHCKISADFFSFLISASLLFIPAIIAVASKPIRLSEIIPP